MSKEDEVAAKVSVDALGPPTEWRWQQLQEDTLRAGVLDLPMPIDKIIEVWNIYLSMSVYSSYIILQIRTLTNVRYFGSEAMLGFYRHNVRKLY